MNQLILWSALNRIERERNARAWRRYSALQDLLGGQVQKISALDAMLGVLVALEGAFFIWFLDKTYSMGHVFNISLTWLMLVPILLSTRAAFLFRAERSPDATSFEEGLLRNENVTLDKAIAAVVDDFDWNLGIAEIKESTLLLSMVVFLMMAIAYMLGSVLGWR